MSKSMVMLVVYCIMVLISVGNAAKKHTYQKNDEVPLYVNTIGPYSNPTETYR